jgi:exodeoxyribonuclease-5
MEWTAQQSNALQRVQTWLNTPSAPQIFRLFGYAGTGKTTLAKEIESMVRGRTMYMAYTGKASLVLRSKGCAAACTIHSAIYKADDNAPAPCPTCKGLREYPIGTKCATCSGSGDGKSDGKPIFRLNPESPVRGAGLVTIDECSMVDEEVGGDLLGFGARVLVLGDPAQLPPVKGAGFFTEATPDVLLTDIRRQALDDPIVRMSMDVREGRGLALGTYGESRVIQRKDIQPGEIMAADQVLCGTNNTRRGLNSRFRSQLGYTEDYPQEDDRLVCLKNDRLRQLFNGGLWTATNTRMSDRIVTMSVVSDDDGGPVAPVPVIVPIEYFYGTEENLPYYTKRRLDAFDFGYALTVHKSQGSQWNHVMLFDESRVFRENAHRHLYTGLTRAAEKVTVIV